MAAARVLVDTGAIVAYLHRGDAWHKAAVRFFRGWRGELLTTWPVVTEAVYLSEAPKARLAIMQWLQRNLQALSLEAGDTARIERYYSLRGDARFIVQEFRREVGAVGPDERV